jgi:hypothetical protein
LFFDCAPPPRISRPTRSRRGGAECQEGWRGGERCC